MKKVLIANRGEIALRVIRACHDLGLQTVAVYSTADAEALHVLAADEAICIGEPAAAKSYLRIPNILSAAEITHADAIHPGYGFLSENAAFVRICEQSGINFIGPSSESIAMLGDKVQAKETAKRVGCPVIPGSNGVVPTVELALVEAERIGYPVFIKAVAGGGGKGIRIAKNKAELPGLFSQARSEAESGFGNPDVYMEKQILNPRHIEVQVIGDKFGNYAYLGERDCTIQRRRQKLIEEAPSPVLNAETRKRMGEAAVALAKEAGYHSLGTVEFLYDKEGKFYFLEVNTRVQVEHTVTEEVCGIDLVRAQIEIAMGKPLAFKQEDVQIRGHAIQFRINAEAPERNFAPSPGRLEYFIAPGGPHVRVDTACYSGGSIPPHYDAMIAKLIVHGRTREEAMDIGKRALREFYIGGISSTIGFHQYMLEDPHFRDVKFDLLYIDKLIESGCTFQLDS